MQVRIDLPIMKYTLNLLFLRKEKYSEPNWQSLVKCKISIVTNNIIIKNLRTEASMGESRFFFTCQGNSPKLACPAAGVMATAGTACTVPHAMSVVGVVVPVQQYSCPAGHCPVDPVPPWGIVHYIHTKYPISFWRTYQNPINYLNYHTYIMYFCVT